MRTSSCILPLVMSFMLAHCSTPSERQPDIAEVSVAETAAVANGDGGKSEPADNSQDALETDAEADDHIEKLAKPAEDGIEDKDRYLREANGDQIGGLQGWEVFYSSSRDADRLFRKAVRYFDSSSTLNQSIALFRQLRREYPEAHYRRKYAQDGGQEFRYYAQHAKRFLKVGECRLSKADTPGITTDDLVSYSQRLITSFAQNELGMASEALGCGFGIFWDMTPYHDSSFDITEDARRLLPAIARTLRVDTAVLGESTTYRSNVFGAAVPIVEMAYEGSHRDTVSLMFKEQDGHLRWIGIYSRNGKLRRLAVSWYNRKNLGPEFEAGELEAWFEDWPESKPKYR